MEFIPRFLTVPADHFFLLGPRGTGKTCWTQSLFSNALRIDLLDPATLRDLSAKPERLRERMDGYPSLETVLIDEVQKLPQLLEEEEKKCLSPSRLPTVFQRTNGKPCQNKGRRTDATHSGLSAYWGDPGGEKCLSPAPTALAFDC